MSTATVQKSDWQILASIFFYCTFFLAAGFVAALWLEKMLAASMPQYADDLRIAVMLFLLWLVISAGLRSADKVRKNMEGWKLMLTGLCIALAGSAVFNIFRLLFPSLIWSEEMTPISGFHWQSCLFFGVIGFVLSLISVIRQRISSKLWSNVLIFLVIAGIFLLIYYFA